MFPPTTCSIPGRCVHNRRGNEGHPTISFESYPAPTLETFSYRNDQSDFSGYDEFADSVVRRGTDRFALLAVPRLAKRPDRGKNGGQRGPPPRSDDKTQSPASSKFCAPRIDRGTGIVPNHPQRLLVIVLRVLGCVDLTALVAVVMPNAWMAAIHAAVGLGEFPETPLVGYLTRSASALYALHGAMILFVSFDVDRYRPLITFMALAALIQGLVILAIDLAVGMPTPWILVEAPAFIGTGLAVLVAQRAIPSSRGES
jgi:hypothetical protein